jgi:hypothetical protein
MTVNEVAPKWRCDASCGWFLLILYCSFVAEKIMHFLLYNNGLYFTQLNSISQNVGGILRSFGEF